MTAQTNSLFKDFTFKKGLNLKNRVAMAPMTSWSSNDDYTISEEEVQHYRARVKDVGLVITGCSRIAPNGIGFTNEFASYDDSFIPSLKKLADAAKSGGAPAILQIYHAGNKAISQLIENEDVVSASAVALGSTQFVENVNPPRALEHDEILGLIQAFGETTKRAIEAGFDGVELHGAHGFLIQNFFSPIYNQRTDYWGGSDLKRMNFPLEVVKEVQRVIDVYAKRPFVLGYRITPEEPQAESYKIKDIYPLIDELIELKIDYLHASLADVLESRPIGKNQGKTLAELILEKVNNRIPVIAAGNIKRPEDAEKAIELGLSIVAIGQALIINPDWVEIVGSKKKVKEALSKSDVPNLAIPKKLWAAIDAATGWFPLTP